jgi:hypothetical protein
VHAQEGKKRVKGSRKWQKQAFLGLIVHNGLCLLGGGEAVFDG